MFTLYSDSKKCVQIDGVAMGSPLGPVLANIFMVERKQIVSPTRSLWKRYVDDTTCFVNSNFISHVLESLNSFHSNIKFTIKIEKESKIEFLNILIRYKDLINTTVCHKKMNTDLYINWKSFSPNNWR